MMEKPNITKTDWILIEGWTPSGKKIESHLGAIIASVKRMQDAEAIVKAVNNTYGAGIDPEAAPDMKEALMASKRFVDVMADPSLEIDMELKEQITEALEKAGVTDE